MRTYLAVAMGLALAGSAGAIPFTGSVIGSWDNVAHDADDVWSISNQDDGGSTRSKAVFNWGMPSNDQSMLSFDGTGSDDGEAEFSADLAQPFSLGKVKHYNGRNESSSVDGITGVDLNVLMSITSPITGSDTYAFGFGIVNTPNSRKTAEDLVIASTDLTPTLFEYDGNYYTLELLGFSKDGGATISDTIRTPEGKSRWRELYGQIVSVNIGGKPPTSVPDLASTASLLIISLGGLAWIQRFVGRG